MMQHRSAGKPSPPSAHGPAGAECPSIETEVVFGTGRARAGAREIGASDRIRTDDIQIHNLAL
jgi:hypothetical protein